MAVKVPDAATLLAAYDEQLRLEAEVRTAKWVRAFTPVLLAAFADRGYVTYKSLSTLTLEQIDQLVATVVSAFRDGTDVQAIEWKTRGHDLPTELTAILRRHDFAPGPEETIMAGPVSKLTRKVASPSGVTIRRAGEAGDLAEDVRRVISAQTLAFTQSQTDDPAAAAWLEGEAGRAAELMFQLQGRPTGLELWLAEAEGKVVGSGRVDVVEGTDFAGLWGGSVTPAWRGRGVYRALLAARAQAAKGLGAKLLYCDASPDSARVLTRAGLQPISTTIPYVWTRDR